MASLNLLVGYGSDSDSSEETDEGAVALATQEPNQSGDVDPLGTKNFFDADDSSCSNDGGDAAEQSTETCQQNKLCSTLINPFRSSTSDLSAGTSVFANPFKEAEDAKKRSLEKHVKFAPKLDDIVEINGRKICWNYRKGRCRFGDKCTFAHDCELLQKKPAPMDPAECVFNSPEFEQIVDVGKPSGKNKRPGLSEGIIPSKKVMKRYHQQRANEQPVPPMIRKPH